MTLLEAVNLCLRSTGESNVDALESGHPQIETILSEIDAQSKRLQRQGWYFNTRRQTLVPDDDTSQIDVSGLDAVIPVQRNLPYYPQNGVLVDGSTGLPVGVPVDAKTRWLYPTTEEGWADMPGSFTDYVAATAALSYASNYDADPNKLQSLSTQLALYRIEAKNDNIRQQRVNMHVSGSAGINILNAWGPRYGRYR